MAGDCWPPGDHSLVPWCPGALVINRKIFGSNGFTKFWSGSAGAGLPGWLGQPSLRHPRPPGLINVDRIRDVDLSVGRVCPGSEWKRSRGKSSVAQVYHRSTGGCERSPGLERQMRRVVWVRAVADWVS